MIVFSQIVNYIPEPDAVLARYAKLLTPGGRLIVSLFNTGRTRAAWSLIEKRFEVEDAMSVTQGAGTTITKVLKPRR